MLRLGLSWYQCNCLREQYALITNAKGWWKGKLKVYKHTTTRNGNLNILSILSWWQSHQGKHKAVKHWIEPCFESHRKKTQNQVTPIVYIGPPGLGSSLLTCTNQLAYAYPPQVALQWPLLCSFPPHVGMCQKVFETPF